MRRRWRRRFPARVQAQAFTSIATVKTILAISFFHLRRVFHFLRRFGFILKPFSSPRHPTAHDASPSLLSVLQLRVVPIHLRLVTRPSSQVSVPSYPENFYVLLIHGFIIRNSMKFLWYWHHGIRIGNGYDLAVALFVDYEDYLERLGFMHKIFYTNTETIYVHEKFQVLIFVTNLWSFQIQKTQHFLLIFGSLDVLVIGLLVA